MGTTTPPADKMPNTDETNSGQFFTHSATRSPGLTPNLPLNSAATARDCADSVA